MPLRSLRCVIEGTSTVVSLALSWDIFEEVIEEAEFRRPSRWFESDGSLREGKEAIARSDSVSSAFELARVGDREGRE